MKFGGGKIHNCDTKIKFDFGSDRVKVKRGQKVKSGQKPFRGICALSERLFLVIIIIPRKAGYCNHLRMSVCLFVCLSVPMFEMSCHDEIFHYTFILGLF